MSTLVSIRNVIKGYVRGRQRVEVLHALNLDVDAGEFLALMGPSGSGKTTLLNLIGGLDKPDRGEITVAGERIDQLSSGQLAKWRARHVGFIFQIYNLLPVLTAERNVEVPLLLTRLGAKERKRNVYAALELVGLADRAKHKPSELSGGQQQRVAIARAGRGSDAARLRRADRRPRPRDVGVDPRVASAPEQEAGQDDRDGHARPARGRSRVASALRRQGLAGRGARRRGGLTRADGRSRRAISIKRCFRHKLRRAPRFARAWRGFRI